MYGCSNDKYGVSFGDLISRIPEFDIEIQHTRLNSRSYRVNSISCNNSNGFDCNVFNLNSSGYIRYLKENGYCIEPKTDKITNLKCSSDIFSSNKPLFLHDYVNKLFEVIPSLYIVEDFDGDGPHSELGIVYMALYFLGMVCRYYPTHWISLIHGEIGDVYWPILNRAQHYVRETYPELVIEFINCKIKGVED